MQPATIKKIVVIGPESTGKSTLCQQLADHYQTIWCPEFAREYLLKHGMNYSYNDLLTIARGQLEMEENMESRLKNLQFDASKYSQINNQQLRLQSEGSRAPTNVYPPPHPQARPFFIDTDMYVMKVWCEFVFGKCHEFIIDQIEKRQYDLYLLCNVDLPWVKDELREYPDLLTRQKLYDIYKDMMTHQKVPWVDISGNYGERLKKAITAVNKITQSIEPETKTEKS